MKREKRVVGKGNKVVQCEWKANECPTNKTAEACETYKVALWELSATVLLGAKTKTSSSPYGGSGESRIEKTL